MNDIIYDELSFMRRELTSLNKTVSHLNGDLEQHKKQTTSVLVDLHSSINRSYIEQLNLIDEMESVLTEKLTHIEGRLVNQLDDLDSRLDAVNTTSDLMRGDLSTVKGHLTSLNETVSIINGTISHLSGDIEQHKNHTIPALANLQTLDSKLVSGNANMTEEITSLENQLSAKLNEQTAYITAYLKSFINMSHTELLV